MKLKHISNKSFLAIIVLLSSILLVGCAKNALTGKKQLALVANTGLLQYADIQYDSFLLTSKVVKGTADANLVQTIGKNLASAITKYYTDKGLAKELEIYKWEYNLIESKEANAWCMPGGKIAVYTGLLPITKNKNALAVVMGHEIAHAIAEHGAQRASGQTLQQIGEIVVAVGTSGQSQAAQQGFMQAYGVASTYAGMLPFSRKHELEADKLGLLYAAMAGYDPREAVPLWQRMGEMSQGQAPPEIASTHPAEERRIMELEKMMPEAMKYYEASVKK